MNQGLIPSRYAKALYKFAVEKGKADRVYVLMKIWRRLLPHSLDCRR